MFSVLLRNAFRRPVRLWDSATNLRNKNMKKIIAITALSALLVAPAICAEKKDGGFGGACVGCCFGIRTVAAYNEGKKLHVRDILDLLSIGRIWSAISGYQGITTSELQKEAPGYF